MVRTMPQVWMRDSEVTFRGSPAYPGWPGNCLVEELRNCHGGWGGYYQEHKTGSVLGKRTTCGKMQGWEIPRPCLGELEQHNHRTWAEKGQEFIKVIMFKFTQAVFGPRFDKPSLLESDVAACSHGLSWWQLKVEPRSCIHQSVKSLPPLLFTVLPQMYFTFSFYIGSVRKS